MVASVCQRKKEGKKEGKVRGNNESAGLRFPDEGGKSLDVRAAQVQDKGTPR
jgi:hypothetical protein